MQEKKEKMTLMQSLCAFSYPRACYRLLSLIRTLDLRSKVLSFGSKNKSKFILYFSRLFVPLHASSGVHGRYWPC